MRSWISCFGCCSTKSPKAKAFYHKNGHRFMSQHVKINAVCDHCNKRFWNLKRKGHICIFCDVVVHKKCRKFVSMCGEGKKDEQGSAQVDHVQETTPSKDEQGSAQVESIQETTPSKDEQGSAQVDHVQETTPSKDEQGSAHVIQVQVHVPAPTPSKDEQGSAQVEQVQETTPSKDEQGSAQVESIQETTPSKEKRPHAIEDFDFIKLLGEGAYGKVHLVRAKQDQNEYALKTISKRMDKEDQDTIWTERTVLSQTSGCPFLVKMTSCFQTPTKLCFLMDYISGGNLYDFLDRTGQMPEEHIRFYTAEMSLGLRFLHECHIIHRDFKPDNILIDGEGHIKITDFGLSKTCFNEKKGTDTTCGTLPFCAPEIHMTKVYGYAVDWWAMGVVIYMITTLEYPFAENIDDVESEDLMNAITSKPVKIPASVSEDLYALLKGLLRKDPAKRLGCWPEPGFLFLKCHPFFAGLDWGMVENRAIPPPYKPGSEELCVVSDKARLSSVKQEDLKHINQNDFSGFDCVTTA